MEYLIINQTYPFDSNTAQNSLEFAIALSTFEQKVKLLFINNGIFQLLKNQNPNLIYKKDFIKTFTGLSMYDIFEVYVDEESIKENNINVDDLLINVKVINTEQMTLLIDNVDVVFNV